MPAMRARDADELVVRGAQRRRRLAPARAVVRRPRRRESERARRDCVARDATHRVDVVGGRGLAACAALAHDVEPHRAVWHLRGDVDVERARRQVVEVFTERFPGPRDALVQRRAGDVFDALHELDDPVVVVGPARREPDAAVAHHDRRDAVPRRRHQPVVPRGLAVVMRMDVDEARRHQRAICVDDPRRSAVDVSDRDDEAVVDGDIAAARRRASAVDHRAATDHQFVRWHRRDPTTA